MGMLISLILATGSMILGLVGTAGAQDCPLSGAYRINVEESDQLYSVVRGATSRVPFGDQQRFFMDLSTRLTPPDILAIECSGRRVSVGSSRAPRATFLADGRLRRERTPAGNFVQSRVRLSGDTLTFTSTGQVQDRVSVAFQALDGGRRMRVTRRIYAEQLNEPILIQSVYDKVADRVRWDAFGEALVAGQTFRRDDPVKLPSAPLGRAASEADALRAALNAWIEATNRKDIATQMTFYLPVLKAYYLTRNTSRNAVRVEKNRAFAAARSIRITALEPEIVFQDGGRTAVMRFRKQYNIAQRSSTKRGEVVQELRWQRTSDGWRIFSERDVRVIR